MLRAREGVGFGVGRWALEQVLDVSFFFFFFFFFCPATAAEIRAFHGGFPDFLL